LSRAWEPRVQILVGDRLGEMGALAVGTAPQRDSSDPAPRPPPGGTAESLLGETEELERRFDAAMINVYLEAATLGYLSTRSIEMVRDGGGVAIAREILAADRVHRGLEELFLLGRLDLAVEYQVLLPEYEPLFSHEERRTAQLRIGLARRIGHTS
jgi:hypothetical protein